MKSSLISLNIYHLKFGELATFAQKIHNGFIDFVADYPAPDPTMLLFQSRINKLNSAIVKWGVKGNRGSHKQYVALQAAVVAVREDLRRLSNYAMCTMRNDAKSWAGLGFAIKLPNSKPQQLQMVQDLHHFISRTVPPQCIKLKWKKPLGSGERNVKVYVIQRSNTPVLPVSPLTHTLDRIQGFSTETSFIDRNPLPGDNWYWLTAFGSAGYGVTSKPILVVSGKA
jgi:hypothetical protein